MVGTLPIPLGGPPPAELLLTLSPLVRVLAQARFSSVLRIDTKEGVALIQEQLRASYPLLEQLSAPSLQLNLESGVPNFQPTTTNVWRLSDPARAFTISLTSDTVTLEARQYAGRTSFLSRWAEVLRHLEQAYAPSLALRAGVRYLNRLKGDSLARLDDWVRPNVIGVALPDLRDHVNQAISEANMTVEEGALILRWGVLPPGTTIDPGLMEPVPDKSWILDIDVFSTEQKAFDSATLSEEFESLTARAYSVFRWVVTPQGLDHFGASA